MKLEQKVKGLLKSQNKMVKDLCKYVDITDTGLRKMYARDSCETSVLIKIAAYFSVSPSYFFDEDNKVSIVAGDDAIVAGRDAKNVNSFGAIQEMLNEVSAQRQLTEKAMAQIERLVGIIETMQKQN